MERKVVGVVLLLTASLAGCAPNAQTTTPTPAKPVPSAGPDRDQWAADFAGANGLQINDVGAKALGEGTCRDLAAGGSINGMVNSLVRDGRLRESEAIIATAIGPEAYCPKYNDLLQKYLLSQKVLLDYPR